MAVDCMNEQCDCVRTCPFSVPYVVMEHLISILFIFLNKAKHVIVLIYSYISKKKSFRTEYILHSSIGCAQTQYVK